MITGIFLELMRAHFRKNSEQFTWTSDTSQTKLIIEPIQKLNFEEVQARPAVYVARGAVQYSTRSRLAINDQAGINLQTGNLKQKMLVSCAVQMIPVGRRMGEVERLAEEVAEVLLVFKSLIRQDYGFTRFDLAGISPLGVVQEDREYFTAPVTVQTEFTDAWAIEPFAPKINEILVDIRTGLEDQLASTVIEGTPFDGVPNNDDECPKPSFIDLPPSDLQVDEADEETDELGPPYGSGPYI